MPKVYKPIYRKFNGKKFKLYDTSHTQPRKLLISAFHKKGYFVRVVKRDKPRMKGFGVYELFLRKK